MHTKLADKGLVVLTVSVDPPHMKDLVEQANDFLRKQQPPFVNLHLDEPEKVWGNKLGFTFPPCVYVFDRRGKWIRFRGLDYDEEKLHHEVEKTVRRLLEEK
jgi:hypothetical protein